MNHALATEGTAGTFSFSNTPHKHARPVPPRGLERDVLPASTSPPDHSCFLQPLRGAPLWGPGWSDLLLHTLVPLRNTAVEPLALEGLWEAVGRSPHAQGQLDTSAWTPAPTASPSATREHCSATLTAGDTGWVQRLAGRAEPSGLRRPSPLVLPCGPDFCLMFGGISLKDFLLS